MEAYQIRIFQSHLLDQFYYLLFSAQQIDDGLKDRDTDRVFYSIQNFLNAGANISKLLFGQRGKYTEKRRPLRDSIEIQDDSPLRAVTMRNNFEHMDERLDVWWEKSITHNIADKMIGPKGKVVAGIETTGMFRQYDPSISQVTFWDEEFNLKELITEVRRVLPKLQIEARKPHWE